MREMLESLPLPERPQAANPEKVVSERPPKCPTTSRPRATKRSPSTQAAIDQVLEAHRLAIVSARKSAGIPPHANPIPRVGTRERDHLEARVAARLSQGDPGLAIARALRAVDVTKRRWLDGDLRGLEQFPHQVWSTQRRFEDAVFGTVKPRPARPPVERSGYNTRKAFEQDADWPHEATGALG